MGAYTGRCSSTQATAPTSRRSPTGRGSFDGAGGSVRADRRLCSCGPSAGERGCAVQRAMASSACRRSWAACSVVCRRAAMDWVRAVACPSSWESVSSSGRTSQRCFSCRYCCWAVDRAAWASSYWRRAAWRSSCCHWASCCCSSSNWCWASCSRSCAALNCSRRLSCRASASSSWAISCSSAGICPVERLARRAFSCFFSRS